MARFCVVIFLLGFFTFPAAGLDAVPPASPGGETFSVPPPALQGQAEEKEPAAESSAEDTLPDPLEPWNRLVFQFNDKLYFWALKPAAQGYAFVVPEPVRVSVRNVFTNATMPIRFVNSVLQGKMKGAGSELARFGINTTIGLAGIFDPARSWWGIDGQKEDFGQTLGFYGMPGLMSIQWPVLGPSNVRDTIGSLGDLFLNPTTYLNAYAGLGVRTVEVVNQTSLSLGEYESLKEASLDPYGAVMDANIQYRRKLIAK